jgi:hypothetical protein
MLRTSDIEIYTEIPGSKVWPSYLNQHLGPVRRIVKMDKGNNKSLPRTVDEAADILISDLLADHVTALYELDQKGFDWLCEMVSPILIDEFRLWTGNNALLNSCLQVGEWCSATLDPARVILQRVKERIGDTDGIIIIT